MDVIEVQCPYCLQWIELTLDPQTTGSMVEDCEVCCRPWQLHVDRDEDGEPAVSIQRV